jgi:hypothetical protein
VPGSFVNSSGVFPNTQNADLTWGSFDDSTNPPIIYPEGAGLTNVENQILAQLSPVPLPPAIINAPYSVTNTISGGAFVPPYTWSLGADPVSLAPTSLPKGLTLSSNGVISGTPAIGDATGTYDFILQLTDADGRSVTWNDSINVDPIGSP